MLGYKYIFFSLLSFSDVETACMRMNIFTIQILERCSLLKKYEDSDVVIEITTNEATVRKKSYNVTFLSRRDSSSGIDEDSGLARIVPFNAPLFLLQLCFISLRLTFIVPFFVPFSRISVTILNTLIFCSHHQKLLEKNRYEMNQKLTPSLKSLSLFCGQCVSCNPFLLLLCPSLHPSHSRPWFNTSITPCFISKRGHC